MLKLHKMTIVFACFISTTAMAMDIEFNWSSLRDYKEGISQMVQDGTENLANADKNQAFTLYKAEEKRLTTIKDSDNVFDADTCARTQTLIDATRSNPAYQDVLRRSIAKVDECGLSPFYHFHNEHIDASKEIAAYAIMGLLKERGVVFPTKEQLGSNPKGHEAFLRVNETVSPKAAPWFIPGSFSLLYFRGTAEREVIAADQRARAALRASLEEKK